MMITHWLDYQKRWGRWKVAVQGRRRSSYMGRFGGGWQWNIGVQAGSTTVIINLLILSIRISRTPVP